MFPSRASVCVVAWLLYPVWCGGGVCVSIPHHWDTRRDCVIAGWVGLSVSGRIFLKSLAWYVTPRQIDVVGDGWRRRRLRGEGHCGVQVMPKMSTRWYLELPWVRWWETSGIAWEATRMCFTFSKNCDGASLQQTPILPSLFFQETSKIVKT